MTITIHSSYMRKSLSIGEIRECAVTALRGVEFDTVVGTGLSGILPLTLLAEKFNVHYCAVRKPNDSSHSDGLIEGTIGDRWLFVDDFISSGATFNRVYEAVYKAAHRAEHRTTCVGAFEYERPDWLMYHDWSQVRRVHGSISAMHKRICQEVNAPKPDPKPTDMFSLADWFGDPSMRDLRGLLTFGIGDENGT